jgi:uncharacterized DUF497 family protein
MQKTGLSVFLCVRRLGELILDCTGILYYVAFVDRHRVRRIISLRRANRREVTHYVQAE